MNTENNNNQPNLFSSRFDLRKIGIAAVVIVSVLIALVIAPNIAKSDYEPKVPAAQAEYDRLRKNATDALRALCREGWQALNGAKIDDERNGAGQEPPRMDEWNENIKKDCSPVEAPTSF